MRNAHALLWPLAFAFLVFASKVSAASKCFVAGKPVQCPQFLDQYGWVIGIIIFLIFIVIGLYVLVQLIRSWTTGKLSISLGKQIFAPGEAVSGKISIELKKPVQVSKGTVTLESEVRTSSYSNGRNTSSVQVFPIASLPVKVQANYPAGKSEAEFSITIPVGMLSGQDKGVPGAMGSAISIIEGRRTYPARWFVKIDLSTDKAFLSCRDEIEIVQGQSRDFGQQ